TGNSAPRPAHTPIKRYPRLTTAEFLSKRAAVAVSMRRSGDSWLESVPVYLGNPLGRLEARLWLLSFVLQYACRQADASAVPTSDSAAVAAIVRVRAEPDLHPLECRRAIRSGCRANCALAHVRWHAMRQHRNRRKAGFGAFASTDRYRIHKMLALTPGKRSAAPGWLPWCAWIQ